MKHVCFVLTMFKSNDCSGGKSIVSLFGSICGRVTWGLSFPELARSGARCGVGWLLGFPCSLNAVRLLFYCDSLLLLLLYPPHLHPPTPTPPAYTASKCVVMVSPGCVWVCEVLAWWGSLGLLTMWQPNKNYPRRTPFCHVTRFPRSSMRVCSIYSRKDCMWMHHC